MTAYIDRVRFRKISDASRAYPIFEAVADDTVLFDLGATDDGVVEFAIHVGAENKCSGLTI
jgi:hypothetical protein